MLVAVLFLSVLGACNDSEPDTAVDAFDEGGEQRVELVTGEPFEATGLVADVVGPNGFMLYDALIVTTSPQEVDKGDRVRVTGAVESADEVVRVHGAKLHEDTRDALAGEDVVVLADEVEVVAFVGGDRPETGGE